MGTNSHEKRPAPASNQVFFQNRSIFAFDIDYLNTIVCCSTCENADLALNDVGVGCHGRP